LIQFAGPKLEGYGEPPVGAPNRDIPIYLGAIAFVPLVWFLFTNLIAQWFIQARGHVPNTTGLPKRAGPFVFAP